MAPDHPGPSGFRRAHGCLVPIQAKWYQVSSTCQGLLCTFKPFTLCMFLVSFDFIFCSHTAELETSKQ